MALLSRLHVRPVLVAEQVEQRVHERSAPGRADDLRADERIPELARNSVGELFSAVHGKGENVGDLVDAEVRVLQAPHLVRAHERDAELALVDALAAQDVPRELGRRLRVDLLPASVLDLDGDSH